MYISRVVVRNFRNLRNLDLRLRSHVTSIIGENNTGKTNLLHAIRLPLDATLNSYHRQLTENDINSGVDISRPEHVVISVEFKDFAGRPNECGLVGCWQVAEDVARLTYRFRPKREIREAIASEDREPTGLTIDDYGWEITGGGDVDPAEADWDDDIGRSVRFADLQFFLVVFLPALRDVQQDLTQTRFSPLSRLFSAADIPQNDKDALVAMLQRANDGIAESSAVSGTGEAIADAFKSTVGEAFEMDVRLGLADPSFSSIARSLTLLLTDGAMSDFETFRNGLGLNNILYISMLLEYFQKRKREGKTAGQLLLIEEPEAHLHPQLQRVLLQSLAAKGCQVVLTTHSTHITSKSSLKSCITLTKTSDGVGAANIARAAALTDDERKDLERYLDATRSTLLFARKVMLVEGPAELFLIPPLVKKVMDVDLDRKGVTVVPIHGVHFAPYAKLFSDDAMPKKCAIVADTDVPSPEADGAGDDPAIPARLEELNSDYVQVFACPDTFEVALTIEGLLGALAATATSLQAPRIAAAIEECSRSLAEDSLDAHQRAELLGRVSQQVLSTAKRFGKARFAQVMARHLDLADDLPAYIREAVEWLVE